MHSYNLSKASVSALYNKNILITILVSSQLSDQFLVISKYEKITNGLFAKIIGKISALTILQCVNFINNKPIGRIKNALN